MEINLLHGDCLELMQDIPNGSVDMILCDLPYGTTACKWDTIIPFEPLWEQYERVIKDRGAILLTGQGLFSAELMLSNKKMYRYSLVWDKVLTSGFLNANRMPLRSHEDVLVFYKKLPSYNPRKTLGKKNHSKGVKKENENNNYGEFGFVDNSEKLGDMKHPKSIITFSKPHPSVSVHPTQKPVPLLEYLIRTYTNEGETVLDNCMGSGSTGVACVNTNRNFIGIELDDKYFEIAKRRIEKHRVQMDMFGGDDNIRNGKMKLSEYISRMRAIQDDMHDGGKMMLKCCMCGDVFDIGYEMPNGDYVCATHECCYEYCRCEGKRTTQESED